MSDIPKNLYYTKTHEWLRMENDGTVILGITDHAQESMGDVVHVDLPEVGKVIEAEGECAVLESVKSASDIYSPIADEIIATNEELQDNPSLINKDAYNSGWLVRIRPRDPNEVKELMNADTYHKYLEEE